MTLKTAVAERNERPLGWLSFFLCLFLVVYDASADERAHTLSAEAVLVQRGLDDVTDMAFAANSTDRLYIVERGGLVRILDRGEILDDDLLDLEDILSSDPGVGLESIAFPPTFATLHIFFISYTDKNGDTILASITLPHDNDDEQTAGPDDMSVLLKIVQPRPIHPRSMLRFGPDGYLYLAIGSTEPQSEPQQHDSLRGGILRLDVSDPLRYRIPSDNPLVGSPLHPHEMWARGVEEVWGLLFQEGTKEALVGLWTKDTSPALYPLEKVRDYSRPCSRGSCASLLPPEEASRGRHYSGLLRYKGAKFPHLFGHLIVADRDSGAIFALLTTEETHDHLSPIASIPQRQIKVLAASPQGEILCATDKGELFTLQ